MNPEFNVTVQVTRRFSASPEQVFNAWLNPEMIGRWMFGPAVREEEILRILIKPIVEGSFSFLVLRQGQEIDHIGEYREIDRPRRLVFTWGIAGESAGQSVVTIEISPLETGSELTLTHQMDPAWAAYKDRTKAGWEKMLEKLAEAVTSAK
jgi:uncharacterized protein YndB with AHSA1/START domain